MWVAWGVLLAADLVQVAVRAPGALTPEAVLWLAGLYAIVTAAAWAILRALFRLSAESASVLLIAGGTAAGTVELVVRSVPPVQARMIAVVAGVVQALVIAGLLRWSARQVPRLLAAGLALTLIAGAFGAVVPTLRRPAKPMPAAPPAAGRTNLLLIVIDTLRADHLGSYGYARPTSPMLDGLAADGVLFERAFAQSSWTKPATASLLTGRCPSQHQTSSETARLPDGETTVAERLRPFGYRTAILSGNPWISPEYGFDQGVDDFISVYDERFARQTLFMPLLRRASQLAGGRMQLYNRVKYAVLGELSTTARDTRLVDEALRWLGLHGKAPFFLYLHMMSPHHPYDPPAPFDRFVPDKAHPPVKNYPRKSYRFFEGGAALPADDLADMLARYDGDVLHADSEVGRLLAGIERLGLASTTAVIVTADHGEEFFDHGNWGHGQSVYNELLWVPLIVRVPGDGPRGARVARPVSHGAVVPTLLDLAGAPREASSCSLLPAAEGCADPLAELLYRYGEARALVHGDRKLVVLRDGATRRTALYDLTADPAEREALPADQADAVRLAAELDQRVQAAQRDRSDASTAVVDEETRRRLETLGYNQ
jgi:arylsulfatase A-like enzyme